MIGMPLGSLPLDSAILAPPGVVVVTPPPPSLPPPKLPYPTLFEAVREIALADVQLGSLLAAGDVWEGLAPKAAATHPPYVSVFQTGRVRYRNTEGVFCVLHSLQVTLVGRTVYEAYKLLAERWIDVMSDWMTPFLVEGNVSPYYFMRCWTGNDFQGPETDPDRGVFPWVVETYFLMGRQPPPR